MVQTNRGRKNSWNKINEYGQCETRGSSPRVSVVLPTYNDLKHLPRSVESVLTQTFKDFELIIVNDGSTDGTREYLDSLTDPRVRVIHQENKRLPRALNAGFESSRGELLTWTSSDNYCAPNFLERMAAALDAYPDAGFAYSAFAWVNEQDEIFGITQDKNLVLNNILATNPGVASFMYRRECMERVGLYDPELEGTEDWDMWLRIVEQFPTVYVPEVLYYYKTHDGTMTAKQPELIRKSCRKTFEKALRRMNNEIDLARLFPAIELCKDQISAQFYACFDFGTRLIQAPFDAAEEACDFLEAALAINPESAEVASNLTVAYVLAGKPEKAKKLIKELQSVDDKQVCEIINCVADALSYKDNSLLSSAPLFLPDKDSIELFKLEKEQMRVFDVRKQSSVPDLEPSEGIARSLPDQVNFLMTDKCNARSVMCGGNYSKSKSDRRIRLGKFKRMAENLRLGDIGRVCLAGAGDPLLNPDLVPIINYINKTYPNVEISITTNGIGLTRPLAEKLAKCRISLINFSLNAASPETYKRIMQVDKFEQVCENIRNFISIKNSAGAGPVVRLSSAINRLNIEELPEMVELAHKLGVEAVNVMYCRFYPESIRHLNVSKESLRLENDDSLFYHQELSDEMVEKTEEIARWYGITFTHEPLFKENAQPYHCTWPYAEIMVGFDGEIYPCGGAEVHFKEKVESNTYHFGNALSESIDEFWNAEMYRKLRVSVKQDGRCFTQECSCCANVIRPNEAGMHIMDWQDDGHRLRKQVIEPSEDALKPKDGRPLVSVIVPTFNRLEHLPKTIQSILNQTYPNIEIVVVNDAGQDVSAIIHRLNSRGNIRYICHTENRGLAATRNTGILAAKGKYIAYLDDDDVFYLNHIETLVTFLESSDYKVAYTDAVRAHQKLVDGKLVVVDSDIPYSYDFDYDRILACNFIPVLCVMHEKSCTDEVGLFDEQMRAHEDWDLWARMSRVYEFAHIREVTCEFAWRSDGGTMTSGSQAEYLRTMEIIYAKGRRYSEGKLEVIEWQQEYLQARRQAVDQEVSDQLKQVEEIYTNGNVDEAFARLLEIVNTYPNHPAPHNDLGVVYFQRGEKEKARYHFERALEIDPMFLDAQVNLADLEGGVSVDDAQVQPANFPTTDTPLAEILSVLPNSAVENQDRWSGVCPICGNEVDFEVTDTENLRESLACPVCKSISRDRLLIRALGLIIGDNRSLSEWNPSSMRVFETTGHRGHPQFLSRKFDYYNTEYVLEVMQGKFDSRRYADLQNMPYQDNFFDAILTSDVFEHVRLYKQAVSEAYRVLKPGGVMLLQIPYSNDMPANQVLVQPDGDEDIFLTEPQYHAEDTLVYRIYGREFLDDLRSAGFEVEYVTTSSAENGISHQGIIVCRKPAASACSSAPDDEVVATMKGDWNQRAVEDAKYYVHSTKRDQSEEEFDASGWDSVKSIVLDDLQTITGDTDPKTMRVLEIGCGLGRMTKHLAGVFGEVHGVDVSGEMIRGAKQRLKSVPNAFVYETNGKDLSLFADEMFDFAFSFIVFQHIPFKEVVINYIREAHRVLKRGGVFKFQVQGCVNPTWLAMPKDTWHGVTITEEDIDQLSAELGFELVRKWGQGTQYSWYILRKIAVPQQVELPQLSKPVVSIVIPVYNGLKLTQACLRSIAVNTEAPCYEVIVVDNASKDGTTEFLRQQTDPSIKAIFNDENKGFVEACNAGAAAASGDFVLFLNNDTEVQPGWLSALVGFASNTPDCGAVGSRLIYPNGRLQEAGGIIFSDGNGWNYGKGLSPTEPKFNFVREVDYCSGAALMVRKDLWDEIGGFDLRYAPAYYEDTDLCFEVRKRGYKVYYQPKSIVIHYEGQTAGTSLQEGFKRYQVENRHKFVEKWRGELASQCANDPNNVVKASSRGTRGSVLVVDPFLPFFDQASGSLRLFQMLKILKQLGFHVTFIARNPLQESKYRPILEDLGIEVYAGDPAAMKAAGSRLDGVPPISYEVLFSERQFQYAIINFWHVAEAYIPVIRQYSPKTQIIVDTVDIHFLREMREAELKKSLQMIKKALANKRWEITTYRQADRLWVITEQDKQAVQDLLPDMRIDIVPNIHSQVAAVKRFEETSDLLFVGSFKHPPNADAVRFFCKEVFPLVLERIPDAKLFVVGANPPADIQNLASENVIVTGFVQDLSDYLLRARVSISPLRFGAGMKGKVGEALSWGLPVVTTSIGAEGMSLVHEQDALIADDPKSFAEQIIRLYKDRELWNRLSENGKARVAQWSPEAVKSHLDKLLDDPNPAPKPKLVSIVVLVWNQLEYTKKCLESVERCTHVPYELIVVDNGSTDGTDKYLAEYARRWNAGKPNNKNTYCRDVKIIRHETNLGYAAGNNTGIAAAKGDYIVLLNNDVVVTPGWLNRMVRLAEQNSRVGIIGPMSNAVSGVQYVSNVTYDVKNLTGLDDFAGHWARDYTGDGLLLRRVVGFCMMLSRSLVEEIGGLDPRYGIGNFEDDDLCLRTAIAGFKSIVAKDCFVHHFGSRTFAGQNINRDKLILRNWEIFKSKWGLPSDLPFGRNFDLSSMMTQTFDPELHYCPLDSVQTIISQSQSSQWFLAPEWKCPSTWQSVIEEYLRSYRPGDGSVLTLYAGRLTNSTADEAYRLVGDFLERLGVGEEVIPDMEISDELPVDPTVKIILTDGPLDSNLRSGFPDSCVEADALRPAA